MTMLAIIFPKLKQEPENVYKQPQYLSLSSIQFMNIARQPFELGKYLRFLF